MPAATYREPVFLLTTGRSYSTVSIALLAGHPDIYGFPELQLFVARTVGGFLGKSPARQWRYTYKIPERAHEIGVSGVLRTIADLHEGCQSAAAITRARSWLSRRADWSMNRLFDYFLTRIYPRIGIEKSPSTVSTDVSLDACISSHPDARYIHLVRHPVTTQISMHNHWGAYYREPAALISEAASSWYLTHFRIARMLSGRPADTWLRVRAEDLLREPHVWLPKVLGWLGLPCDAQVVENMLRTERWPFANTGTDGSLLGGDPGFMRAPALRHIPEPGDIVFDPAWGLPAGMRDRMIRLAGFLGY
jgi:hypothetical protein